MGIENNPRRRLMPLTVITAPVSLTAVGSPGGTSQIRYVAVQAAFVYGSGGASVDIYVQTTLDGGATWVDVMNFNFTTASVTKISAVSVDIAAAAAATLTDGALASNTVVNGVIGDRFRVKYKTTGTYASNTTVQVDMVQQ